jgi:hypothetical protein
MVGVAVVLAVVVERVVGSYVFSLEVLWSSVAVEEEAG